MTPRPPFPQPMPPTPMSPATAAAHWRSLAAAQREQAEWEKSHGLPFGSVDSYHHRAETYDRTARALELEAETGRPHCSTCLGDHPNHLHPHRG